MAYAVKYRITQATQSGAIQYLDILEDSYVGVIIAYPAISLKLQYVPSSDDIFEPIYASNLSATIDVTDDINNMPNFSTLNDKKYLCKLYSDANLKWQGWALSDEVLFVFSTGRKEITFNAICGLGMLNDIPFVNSTTDLRSTVMHYLTDALNKVAFPSVMILSSCSIYSSSMQNRTAFGSNEPWLQAYMSFTNFYIQKTIANGATENAISSLTALRDILSSWGCRIFMDNGEWNIIQVNQAFENTRFWTRYDITGTVITYGTFTTNINVPTNGIFVNGNQAKIYKKGYNNFISEKAIEFPKNYIFNADLKLYSGNDATLWTRTESGTGKVFIQVNTDKDINAWILALGDSSTSFAQVESNSPIPVTAGDKFQFQFRVYATLGVFGPDGITLLPNCYLKLIIAGGAISYYLSDNNTWKVMLLTGNTYYKVNDKTNKTLVNLEEIPPNPISGALTMAIYLTGTGSNTQSSLIAGDFEITQVSLFKKVTFTANLNGDKTYRKEVVFAHGYNSDITSSLSNGELPAFLGAVTDINGVALYGWYMFERFGVDSFQSLALLMFKNYINMYRKNIINIDATINTTAGAIDVYNFTDTDPSQISVTGKKYIIGNTTFNAPINEMQSTLLEVDNTPQTVTITTKYDNGVDPGISFSMAGASTTKPGACALTTYTLTKYSNKFGPGVGDTIYNEVSLQTTFAGSGLWWKLYNRYYNTVIALRINASGVILESNTC